MPGDPWLLLGAGLVEAMTGYPARLHAWLPHPVTWIARAIRGLEAWLNSPEQSDRGRRLGGVFTLLAVAGSAALIGLALERLLRPLSWGWAPMVVAGSLGLAGRSLYDHVVQVKDALLAGNLRAARLAVAKIVGRDVESLEPPGVASAALESLAESFNDGVVAPLVWFLVAGLPGLFAYKAVNTADSLIGHKEQPYFDFGWASARADDLMNLVPARLAGGLIAVVGAGGWRVMARDAGKHASPNSGWPEAAMAGALGVSLGGPVAYDGVMHPRPTFGDGPAPEARDLARGLRLYLRACAVLVLALAMGGFAWPR